MADNASSDGSLEMLRSEFPVVRLIELDQNYGFAEGYNRALEQVDAEYVVLLNSDVEVTPHWLEPLLDYMDTHSGTVACQPKLLSWHNKEYFEYAGASGGFIDRYGYPFCRGRIFDVVEKDCGQYDTVTEVMWGLTPHTSRGSPPCRWFGRSPEPSPPRTRRWCCHRDRTPR